MFMLLFCVPGFWPSTQSDKDPGSDSSGFDDSDLDDNPLVIAKQPAKTITADPGGSCVNLSCFMMCSVDYGVYYVLRLSASFYYCQVGQWLKLDLSHSDDSMFFGSHESDNIQAWNFMVRPESVLLATQRPAAWAHYNRSS